MGIAQHIIEHSKIGLSDQSRRPNTCVMIGDSHIANGLYVETSLNAASAAAGGTAYASDLGRRIFEISLSATTTGGQALTASVEIQTSPDNSTWTTIHTESMSVTAYSSTSDADTSVVVVTQNALYIRANLASISGTNARVTATIRGFPQQTASNLLAVGNALLGGRLLVLANYGTGGETSTQIAARFANDVIGHSPKPGWVAIMAGENDGDDSATTIANLRTMYDQAKLANINVIAFEMFPVGGTLNTAGDTTARRAVNRWIRQYCEVNPHAVMIPCFGDLVDQTSITSVASGTMPTTYSGDTQPLHLNTAGGVLVGRKVYELLESVLPKHDHVPLNPWDGTNGDPYAVVKNGMMYGTAGSVSGDSPAVTGTDVANLWNVGTGTGGGSGTGGTTTSVTVSKIARYDGFPGSAQRIAIVGMNNPAGANYINFSLQTTSTTPNVEDTYLIPGEYGWFEFDVDYAASVGTIHSVQCQVIVYRSSGYTMPYTIQAMRASTTGLGLSSLRGTLQTPIFRVPSYPTSATRVMSIVMRMSLSDGGSGTFDVLGVRYHQLDATP